VEYIDLIVVRSHFHCFLQKFHQLTAKEIATKQNTLFANRQYKRIMDLFEEKELATEHKNQPQLRIQVVLCLKLVFKKRAFIVKKSELGMLFEKLHTLPWELIKQILLLI